jgi:broad specificity phosphatase PhoE
MPILHFITHPEVTIDPAVPVPAWPLSQEGVRRMGLALGQPWMSQLGSVFSSAERKAMDAAGLVEQRFGLSSVVLAELGENDRSATGYLPKAEFEAMADLFFACPEESVRGWERAVDAQGRIVAAVERVIAEAPGHGDVAVVSHGGVGALLLCHLKGVPISRTEDQPGAGGGCVFSVDMVTRALLSGWRMIEE